MSIKPKKGFCKCEDCPNKSKEVMIRSGKCQACHTRIFRSYGNNKPKTIRHKPTGEAGTFTEIWLKRDHYSQIGGEYLGNIMKPILFSHVLGKGAYNEARLDKDNIFLVTEAEHISIHNESRSDLIKKDKKWIKYFEYYDTIKQRYDDKRIKESRRTSRL
jgi:hypothetical protein